MSPYLYNPITGQLTWRRRKPSHFAHCADPAHACASRNSRFANRPVVRGLNNTSKAQACWEAMTGEKVDAVQHLNGDTSDTRWCNLSSKHSGRKRTKRNKNNTSGQAGVSFHTQSDKWMASIRSNGKRIWLGLFSDKQDAIDARREAEIKYDYKPTHAD